ncbi:MAG: hypothetical protein IT580_04335, partial [Verrucomicrobiales bacterium]|nr:hypothetical protein [Verrucomicrobiales bacterium]
QVETAECLPSRVLVLGSRRDRSTPAAVLAAARRAFRGWPVPLGAGTDADLYQLNLQRPPSEADFVAWTMNPQVHAFDLRSIAETPEGARAQVESVRSYFPGKPLCVSAVSLRPRFNPVATGPRSPVEEGELPASVDPRQPSLFAAAWTLAMLAALSEGGLDSATFFETTGSRGVMETASGPLLPDRFPSSPGVVFPLYHVLADVAAFAGADVLETTCHGARDLHALLLRRPGRTRLLLANLAPHPRRTILQVPDRIVLARSLEVSTTIEAMSRPAKFRERWLTWAGPTLVVPAYGVVTLDTPPEQGQARA